MKKSARPELMGEVKVDPEDAWILAEGGWNVYVQKWGGAVMRVRNGKTQMLHRVVLGLTDPRVLVDHINGDPLDCRKSNMRRCKHGENRRNRGEQRNNKTGFKGVRQEKSGRFRAGVRHEGKRYDCGLFDTAEEAFEAYKKKAAELHGEFVCFKYGEKSRKMGRRWDPV